MNVLLALLQQLPMLLMVVPLCGLISLCLARWWGGTLIRKSFLINGVLSVACALLMVMNFSNGPHRSGLSSAESFQQVNLLLTDVEAKAGYRFGVDGCSLWPVVLAAAFPLFVGWENSASRSQRILSTQNLSPSLEWKNATGLLALQFCILVFLLSLDRRVQMTILPLIAVAVHFLLAVSVSTTTRLSLGRRLRQMLLSDFLIVAGYLCATTPLLRYSKMANHPTEYFDLIRILSVLEELRYEDTTAYHRLIKSMAPSLCMMLFGTLLRFGTFPFTTESRKVWRETSPLIRSVFWLYGPVVGLAVIFRELQLFPDIGFRLFTIIEYGGVLGLVWLSICLRLQSNTNDDSLSMVYFSTLLLMLSGGSNTTSMAGALLILTALMVRALIPESRNSAESRWFQVTKYGTRFFLTIGSTLGLLGLWQSTGPGSRELGLALLTGLSLVLLASRARTENAISSHSNRLLSVGMQPNSRLRGELPNWNITSPSIPPDRRPGKIQTIAVLIAAIVILLAPHWIWQQVRWDFQKFEYPQPAGGFASQEVQP